jgi:DNA-binding Lrp family transcriptional regulator
MPPCPQARLPAPRYFAALQVICRRLILPENRFPLFGIKRSALDPARKPVPTSQVSVARRIPMVPFFVQIKCKLGKSYEVANKLADAEIASEVYSTAGEFDLLAKFYVEESTDIGHFVNEKVQNIPGIQDTRTIITFKAFGV